MTTRIGRYLEISATALRKSHRCQYLEETCRGLFLISATLSRNFCRLDRIICIFQEYQPTSLCRNAPSIVWIMTVRLDGRIWLGFHPAVPPQRYIAQCNTWYIPLLYLHWSPHDVEHALSAWQLSHTAMLPYYLCHSSLSSIILTLIILSAKLLFFPKLLPIAY